SASPSSYFNTYDYSQEDISSYLNIHDHNDYNNRNDCNDHNDHNDYNDIANISALFYSNIYKQDFVNTLPLPYFNANDFDPISSSWLSTNNKLIKSDTDVETRPWMEFKTWELSESYLNDYVKQKGFSFHK
ncbi:12365_t:CDS:2, partial [Dentiscutata erythropus]